MKRLPISEHEIRNPDKILSNLIYDYVQGNLSSDRLLHRAVVVKIDNVGGAFEDRPKNPQGSIIARIISDGYDQGADVDDLTVYWPLFPFALQPIKEGEHVYVMFEDEDREHGLWITRIAEPGEVDNKNIVPGNKKYEVFSGGRVTEGNSQQLVQDSDTPVMQISASQEFRTEPVVDFSPRIGDYTLQGSNNTLINLGRDRITTPNTGLVSAAGSIDLVAGRATSGVDFVNDKSRVYISANTQADANLNVQAGQAVEQGATIVIKSDQIRIIARQGTKIVNEGGEIVIQTPGNVTIEGANINIGLNADQAAVLGNNLQTYIDNFMTAIFNAHIHPTGVGPSGPPTPVATTLPPNALSQTVKVKP